MLRFFKESLAYMDRADRREWLVLLVASFAGGISRSLFLATVNTAAVAVVAHRDNKIFLLIPLSLALISLGTSVLGAVLGKMVSERMVIRMRSQLASEILKTNLRFVEREKHWELHYHLLGTIDSITSSHFVLLSFLSAIVTLFFNAIYIAWLSPIGLLIAVVVAVAAVVADGMFEKANASSRQLLDELRRRSHQAHGDLLFGFKELRLSEAKAKDLQSRIADLDRQIYESSVRVARMSACGTAFAEFFQYLAIGIFGIGFSVLASVPPETILQLIAAVLFTVAPLSNIVAAFPSFGRARVSLQNLRLLKARIVESTEPTRPESSAKLPPFESFGLKDVTFRFENQTGVAAAAEEFRLGPINLTVARGDVVCVIGGNGSGKTVMLRLLTGLYPPSSGEIMFNGRPVAAADMSDYRGHFAAVFNDFFLFNELLGNRLAEPLTVAHWLEHFGISHKTKFADGRFSTIELSTGQRKRLALIVGLLEDRPILMLDEFGAEQDPEHRDQFYRVWLPELRRLGITIVIVSHDDAYFECADMVVRMDFGKIVECSRVEKPMPDKQGALPDVILPA